MAGSLPRNRILHLWLLDVLLDVLIAKMVLLVILIAELFR